MIELFKKYEAVEEDVCKMTKDQMQSAVGDCELAMVAAFRDNAGITDRAQLAQGTLMNCARCVHIACLGQDKEEKAPAIIELFSNDKLQLTHYIESNRELFFGEPEEDTEFAVKYVIDNVSGMLSAMGTLMLLIAYSDGNPSKEALEKIKEYYGS